MPAKESPVELDTISFCVDEPNNIATGDWRAMNRLLHRALVMGLPFVRTRSGQINRLVPQNDLLGYSTSRQNPALSFPGQSFREPEIIRAYEERKSGPTLVGYLALADNTSGGVLARNIKMAIPVGWDVPKIGFRRFAHIREIAVLTEARHRGIASVMALLALQGRHRLQPVTAYTWPTELPQMSAALEQLNMTLTDTQPVYLYGQDQPAVSQERWEGSVAALERGILQHPQAKQMLDKVALAQVN